MKYFERRKKVKLFQQWVNKADLPPEEIPPEVLNGESAKETDMAHDDITHQEFSGYPSPISIDRGVVRLPLRYVLLGLSVIALLLVTTTLLLTVLIFQSCQQ